MSSTVQRTDGSRDGRDDLGDTSVEALLRRRLRAADDEIQPPPGLWARIAESAPAPGAPRSALSLVRRHPQLMAVVFTVAAVVLALGVWRLVGAGGERPVPPGPGTGLEVTVFTSDASCRKEHTAKCALRLAEDPYRAYDAPGNGAGRAWHGDRLATECLIIDGSLVRDGDGAASNRWYRVKSVEGVEGWLPGVHTRDVHQVPLCPSDESE